MKNLRNRLACLLLSALLPSAFGLCACLAVRLISGG